MRKYLEDKNVNLIFDLTDDFDSPGYAYMNKFSGYFKDFIGEEKYIAKTKSMIGNAVSKAAENKYETMLKKAISMYKTMKLSDYKEKKTYYNVMYYGKAQDWVNYNKHVGKYLKKFRKNDAEAHNEVAWNLYMLTKDKSLMNSAEGYSKTAVALDNNVKNNTTLAYILLKQDKLTDAFAAAKTAESVAEEGSKDKKNAGLLVTALEKKVNAATPEAAE